MVQLYSDTVNYLHLFTVDVKLTPYRMLQSFFAVLYLEGIREFKLDIHEWFYAMKKDIAFKELLRPVYFKDSGISHYSGELAESLSLLYSVGLIRRGASPINFGVIFLEYSEAISNFILDEIQDKTVLQDLHMLSERFVSTMAQESV